MTHDIAVYLIRLDVLRRFEVDSCNAEAAVEVGLVCLQGRKDNFGASGAVLIDL